MLSMTWSRTWWTLVGLPVWRSFTNLSPKIDRDDKPWTSYSCIFWKARSTVLLRLGCKSQTSWLIIVVHRNLQLSCGGCLSTLCITVSGERPPEAILSIRRATFSDMTGDLSLVCTNAWVRLSWTSFCFSESEQADFFAMPESLGSSTLFNMAETFSCALPVFASSSSASSSESGRRRMSSLRLASVAVCVSEALVNCVVEIFEDHRHAVLWGLVHSTLRALNIGFQTWCSHSRCFPTQWTYCMPDIKKLEGRNRRFCSRK